MASRIVPAPHTCAAATGVRQAKEVRAHRMPAPDAFAKVLAFARERGRRTPHTKGSCPGYLAPAMVLAYSARLRGIEVGTLTEAHRLDQGVHGQRCKGSRDSITEWNAEMTAAWDQLLARRAAIEQSERFSLHGLKHRGVTDTAGNRGDKQDAAGHKSPLTTGRYDHDLPVVKPPRNR